MHRRRRGGILKIDTDGVPRFAGIEPAIVVVVAEASNDVRPRWQVPQNERTCGVCCRDIDERRITGHASTSHA